MYAVLMKDGVDIPTVISKDDGLYPDYLMAGYEIVFEGTKKECQGIETEILNNYSLNY